MLGFFDNLTLKVKVIKVQGHISMMQWKCFVPRNIMFKYEVNLFNIKEVMANVKVFDNLTLNFKVINRSKSNIYVTMESSWPEDYCV